MPDDNPLSFLLIVSILLLVTLFFTLSEAAITYLGENKLKRIAEEKSKNPRKALALLAEPAKTLFFVQSAATLTSLLAAGVAAGFAFGRVTALLESFLFPHGAIGFFAVFIIIVVLAFFILVFCELLPRRLAARSPEAIALAVSGPLMFLLKLFAPVVWVVSSVAGVLLRPFGADPGPNLKETTEEDILMMVDVGNESGLIRQSEKDMIENIFEFDDITVDEVMTHRTDLVAVNVDDPMEVIVKTAIDEGYSRLPVYDHDLDNIVGVVYTKDLLTLIGKDISALNVRDYMRPALFVPESAKGTQLFHQFKEKKLQMAIIVDEYGGTFGIVTMEDLLESIVGSMQDEYDEEEESIQELSENIFEIEGTAYLDEVEKKLGLDFSEDAGVDTIGGLVIDMLGRIPGEHESPSVCIQGVQFTIISMEDRRIAKLRVEKLGKVEEAKK